MEAQRRTAEVPDLDAASRPLQWHTEDPRGSIPGPAEAEFGRLTWERPDRLVSARAGRGRDSAGA